MMIVDVPGLWLGASGPARRRRSSLELTHYPFRGRLNSFLAGTPGYSRRVRAQRSEVAANAPLPSLEGEALSRRFHAWSGGSGRRYVCSVFPAEARAPLAGLPDFAAAIVIAVRIEKDGLRTPITFFDSGDGSDYERCQTFVAEALAHSVAEWHVHLLASDAQHRRSVRSDLERAQQSQFADSAAA